MDLPEVIFKDDPAGLQAALSAGMDPDGEDQYGNSPLTAAASNALPGNVPVPPTTRRFHSALNFFCESW